MGESSAQHHHQSTSCFRRRKSLCDRQINLGNNNRTLPGVCVGYGRVPDRRHAHLVERTEVESIEPSDFRACPRRRTKSSRLVVSGAATAGMQRAHSRRVNSTHRRRFTTWSPGYWPSTTGLVTIEWANLLRKRFIKVNCAHMISQPPGRQFLGGSNRSYL